jgi:hypothetical protein
MHFSANMVYIIRTIFEKMKIVPFYILCILLVNGCAGDAPRDNPLDPQASGFAKKGSLTGRILIANISVGVSDAAVKSLTEKILVQTDALGYFTLPLLSTGKHAFVCTKTNFTPDTFTVDIQTGVTAEVIRNMNSAPVTISKKIMTRKIDQFWPGTIYSVDIEAEVTDPNGDLDSVWFNVDSLNFPLTSFSAKKFATTLENGAFPNNTIEFLTGRPLYIISRDVNNAVNKSDPFYITHIIDKAAVPISPINGETVNNDSISFRWTQPDITFNYSYTIIVSRVISGVPNLVKTYSGISSIDQQYPADGSMLTLDIGSYVWAVLIVDDFGNYSRSKEYSFVAN